MAALNRTVLHSASNLYKLFDTYKTYKNKSYALNLKAEIDPENTVHIFVVVLTFSLQDVETVKHGNMPVYVMIYA